MSRHPLISTVPKTPVTGNRLNIDQGQWPFPTGRSLGTRQSRQPALKILQESVADIHRAERIVLIGAIKGLSV
jgi:hypothetical protein